MVVDGDNFLRNIQPSIQSDICVIVTRDKVVEQTKTGLVKVLLSFMVIGRLGSKIKSNHDYISLGCVNKSKFDYEMKRAMKKPS